MNLLFLSFVIVQVGVIRSFVTANVTNFTLIRLSLFHFHVLFVLVDVPKKLPADVASFSRRVFCHQVAEDQGSRMVAFAAKVTLEFSPVAEDVAVISLVICESFTASLAFLYLGFGNLWATFRAFRISV